MSGTTLAMVREIMPRPNRIRSNPAVLAHSPIHELSLDLHALENVVGGYSIPLRFLTPNANRTLAQIDNGTTEPEPWSRLGAYAATRGYSEGTVGYAVHNSIGDIYRTLGTVGEERIGEVFRSPEARALYGESVQSDASRRMAEIEYSYWQSVRAENPLSIGGNLGSAVTPTVRDWIQRNVEGGQPYTAPETSTSTTADDMSGTAGMTDAYSFADSYGTAESYELPGAGEVGESFDTSDTSYEE